jgi:hypothetical protein
MHKTTIFLVFTLLLFVFNVSGQNPESLLLKDFKPKSYHKTPVANIEKPHYHVIDAHSHAYVTSMEELDGWAETMDHFGIEKTIILTGATGTAFDSLVQFYGKYPDKFELWCGIDFKGSSKPGWAEKAIKELERCHSMGARGVGEITDKGMGLYSAFYSKTEGLRLTDPEMKKVLERMAELNMPINIHIAEPIWMYVEMDEHNDGLMNGWTWRIDQEAEGVLLHQELIDLFEKGVKANPNTTFIACHFLNCSYDLSILGDMLDKYPNLHADISARLGETSTVPRYTRNFCITYQDRLLYGTDNGFERDMYLNTFRILESADEHFYYEHFGYHWPLYGLELPEIVLEKLYYKNAQKLFNY